MVDTTLRTLTTGSAVADGDLFISRQGADTADKSVTGTQLKAYASQWDEVTGGINYAGGNVGIETLTTTGNITVAGSAQLGDAATDIHGINTAPVAGQMLTTLATFDTDNDDATGVGFVVNFDQNATSSDVQNIGMNFRLNLNGELSNSGGGSPDSIDLDGLAFFIDDNRTFSGTNTNSKVVGLDFTYTTGGVTYPVEPKAEEFHVIKANISANLSSVAEKIGGEIAMSGTGAINYALLLGANGATDNYAIWVRSGDVKLTDDTFKTYWGSGLDASIQFDGSDLIINSENVTADDEVHFTNFSKHTFDAPLEATTVKATSVAGFVSSDGSTGFTGTGAYTNFTIKDGIITAAS